MISRTHPPGPMKSKDYPGSGYGHLLQEVDFWNSMETSSIAGEYLTNPGPASPINDLFSGRHTPSSNESCISPQSLGDMVHTEDQPPYNAQHHSHTALVSQDNKTGQLTGPYPTSYHWSLRSLMDLDNTSYMDSLSTHDLQYPSMDDKGIVTDSQEQSDYPPYLPESHYLRAQASGYSLGAQHYPSYSGTTAPSRGQLTGSCMRTGYLQQPASINDTLEGSSSASTSPSWDYNNDVYGSHSSTTLFHETGFSSNASGAFRVLPATVEDHPMYPSYNTTQLVQLTYPYPYPVHSGASGTAALQDNPVYPQHYSSNWWNQVPDKTHMCHFEMDSAVDLKDEKEFPEAALEESKSTHSHLPLPTHSNINKGKSSSGNHWNGPIQLWQFLLNELLNPASQSFISWTGNDWEFRLKNPEEVARRWGVTKNKPKMNYEKLSRGLRYYYDKKIIEKTPGKRYVYRYVMDMETIVQSSQLQQFGRLQPDSTDLQAN